MSRGLVIGKFYPLHHGHEWLIRTAAQSVEELHIVVCSLPTESIAGEVRLGWIRELFPEVHPHLLDRVLPQTPGEEEKFWEIWDGALRELLGSHLPTHVFGSELYIETLAECFDAKPMILDRCQVPVCGTQIRADPQKFEAFLSPTVRAFYRQQ